MPSSTQRLGTIGATLLLLGVASATLIWIRIALPVFSFSEPAAHAHGGHYPLVLWHAGGGTFMLFAGATALYMGLTRRFFGSHKIFGYAYLIGGGMGAVAAIVLIATRAHVHLGINMATGTLAAAWLAVAAMAYRAIRNRQIEQHREWMIRSYVLTWTFVFCRLVQIVPSIAMSDADTIATVIWASWVIPMIVCELALQWRKGARRLPSVTPAQAGVHQGIADGFPPSRE